MKDVLGPNGPRLCSHECDTCIFKPDSSFRQGPGKLRDGRFKQLVNDAVTSDSYIICHSSLDGDRAICRGFFDRFSTNILRVWSRIGGGFDEVEPGHL